MYVSKKSILSQFGRLNPSGQIVAYPQVITPAPKRIVITVKVNNSTEEMLRKNILFVDILRCTFLLRIGNPL